jgi:hypothetical protein
MFKTLRHHIELSKVLMHRYKVQKLSLSYSRYPSQARDFEESLRQMVSYIQAKAQFFVPISRPSVMVFEKLPQAQYLGSISSLDALMLNDNILVQSHCCDTAFRTPGVESCCLSLSPSQSVLKNLEKASLASSSSCVHPGHYVLRSADQLTMEANE